MSFIPNNQRYPLVAVNINNRFAVPGSAEQPYNALFIGPKVSAGSAATGSVVEITSLSDAVAKLGRGSASYEFCRGYFAAESGNPISVLVVAEDAAWVAQAHTLTFTETSLQAGTLALYAGGKRFAVDVAGTDTVTEIATKVAAAINDDAECVFSAVSAAGVVTATAKNTGEFTMQYKIEHSVAGDEVLPSGLSLAIASSVAGSGKPSTFDNTALDSGKQYILLGTCFNTDNAYLGSLRDELVDRNKATRKIDGYLVTVVRDTVTNLITKGKAFNSQFISLFPAVGNTNISYVNGVLIGQISRIRSRDAAASELNAPLPGLLSPSPSEVFSESEQNTLLLNGVSAYKVVGGQVQISRIITTYKTDTNGVPDMSYYDLGVLLTLSYLRYDINILAISELSGAKIGEDGQVYDSGQRIITPTDLKGSLVARARGWAARGLIENPDAFAESVIVERDADDASRLNVELSPDITNSLLILGFDIKFLL